METVATRIADFTAKAEAVSAVVKTVDTASEALAYALSVCNARDACQLLVSGCEADLSPPGQDLCEQKKAKVIAAPGMEDSLRVEFAQKCEASGISLLHQGLRDHLAGVDIGITGVDWAIAETGTLVIDSTSEEIRLATMVSEIHVALLPVDRIVATADEIAGQLTTAMAAPANYTAFITGASRTADIERVLALGVHGPLELHILLIEGE